MKIIRLFLILCFTLCVSSAEAQKRVAKKTRKTPTKEIVNRPLPSMCGGGVVNSKAISLPKPVFPKEAKNIVASGSITVQVKLDEEGNVIEARACSGHPLLRESAVKAARQAKFKPTLLSGIPVKVSGVIIYNFTPETINDEVVVLACPPNMSNTKVLNGFAINLVKPEYPRELKEQRLSGAVNVQVTIDEDGKLFSATAVSGYQELRKYAVEAVKKSTFKRFVRCGQPVKVIGVIVYNFIPSE
jgi:TonB family protein